jgi:hypothetical protein
MTKKSKSDELESSSQQLAEAATELTAEQQLELMIETLEEFCGNLEANGVHHAVLDAALLTVYAGRFAERGDRDSYEAQLESALEEPWDEVTIH